MWQKEGQQKGSCNNLDVKEIKSTTSLPVISVLSKDSGQASEMLKKNKTQKTGFHHREDVRLYGKYEVSSNKCLYFDLASILLHLPPMSYFRHVNLNALSWTLTLTYYCYRVQNNNKTLIAGQFGDYGARQSETIEKASRTIWHK